MSRKRAAQTDTEDKSLGLATFRQLPEPSGLSLNQLSDALAGMLRSGDDPYASPGAADQVGVPAEDPTAESVDECAVTPRSILEAMLFVGSPQNEPLGSKQVASFMRGVRPAEIDTLVRELNQDYARRGCPYTIVAEGAGYRLTLREQFGPLRDKFHGRSRRARLSQAAIEVLAAVAYHAPVTAEEVARLRGMASGPILLQLVRRQLLSLERNPTQPRKARYRTTDRFLELFGLASLDDLPRTPDLEES